MLAAKRSTCESPLSTIVATFGGSKEGTMTVQFSGMSTAPTPRIRAPRRASTAAGRYPAVPSNPAKVLPAIRVPPRVTSTNASVPRTPGSVRAALSTGHVVVNPCVGPSKPSRSRVAGCCSPIVPGVRTRVEAPRERAASENRSATRRVLPVPLHTTTSTELNALLFAGTGDLSVDLKHRSSTPYADGACLPRQST
jgi:hypothetical protein